LLDLSSNLLKFLDALAFDFLEVIFFAEALLAEIVLILPKLDGVLVNGLLP
jgi:hypothetical protein